MAHAHNHTTEDGTPIPAFSHPMPIKILLATFFALVFFTIITVVVAKSLPLGRYEVWVSMGIATVKASLVLLFFMHMIQDKPFNILMFASCFLFVAFFIGYVLMDTQHYQDDIRAFSKDERPGKPNMPYIGKFYEEAKPSAK